MSTKEKSVWAGTHTVSNQVYQAASHNTNCNLGNLLSRLEGVRRTGNGTYMARCPAHADKSPSLTIRETGDGIVLVHCFAGCSVYEVIATVGMEITDLFPSPGHYGKPERRPFPAADVLRALAFEASVIMSAGISILNGSFTGNDRERLMLAVTRIQSALTASGVNHG